MVANYGGTRIQSVVAEAEGKRNLLQRLSIEDYADGYTSLASSNHLVGALQVLIGRKAPGK